MSHLPSLTAVMPLPEPVGLYVTEISGFSFMNASARDPMTDSMDVDPSVDTI